MKRSDIDDKVILRYLADHQGEWSMDWDVAKATCADVLVKVFTAKMRNLLKRGLVVSCGCSYRGDWEITDKGLALVGRPRTKPYTGY